MKKKLLLLLTCGFTCVFLAGCQAVDNYLKNLEEDFEGLTMVVRTFDEDSQVIDRIEGKSMSFSRNSDFDKRDNEGKTTSLGHVLKITIGKHEIDHVGSSLVAEEKGLHDIFADYRKTVDLKNDNSDIPIINRIVSAYKNDFTGKSKVVLIRSQKGTPLATYSGEKVSINSSSVPNTTELLIDGKRLLIYHCDYTIYDLALLQE
jgi:ATPase (pilT family), putative